MPAKSRPKRKSEPSPPKSDETPAPDAIALLEADHREVEELFAQFEDAANDGEKQAIANAICIALKVHARLEEDLFYPAALEASGETGLLLEAQVEHASARDLIAQIETGAPGEPLFDARVTVLGEYVDHHVAEEEGELFPACRKSGMDLAALGEQMRRRKQELMNGLEVSNPVSALS